MNFNNILMDLIIPQEEVIIETQKSLPNVPVFLGIGVALLAAVLVFVTVKKNKK